VRPIEWNIVPDGGWLVLLTMEEPADGVPASMADFRDSKALTHSKTGRWLGLGRSGVRFGSGPPELRNGIWFVREDPKAVRRFRDVTVEAADMRLVAIDP